MTLPRFVELPAINGNYRLRLPKLTNTIPLPATGDSVNTARGAASCFHPVAG